MSRITTTVKSTDPDVDMEQQALAVCTSTAGTTWWGSCYDDRIFTEVPRRGVLRSSRQAWSGGIMFVGVKSLDSPMRF